MRTIRVLLILAGTAAMAYAVAGAVTTAPEPRHAFFLGAVLVAHDAILMPAFLLVGSVVRRRVAPGRPRALVQAAGIATATVAFVSLPLIVGNGRDPGNPSTLPGSYPVALLAVTGLIWLAAATLWLVDRVVSARRP